MNSYLNQRPVLLEQLSDLLARTRNEPLSRDAWLTSDPDDIRLGDEKCSVLCADGLAKWDGQDAEGFAKRSQAHCQMAAVADYLFFFPSPELALAAALSLMRGSLEETPRLAIATGRFAYAELHQSDRLFFGEDLARAEHTIHGCVPGTVLLCAQTYVAVRSILPSAAPEAIIAAELVGDAVIRALVTLPPARSAMLSTFAGLGST